MESFNFALKENANILTISNEDEFCNLLNPYISNLKYNLTSIPVANFTVDWKRLAEDYDAIEVYAGSNEFLSSILYGWDCDSICVFHKEVIVLL